MVRSSSCLELSLNILIIYVVLVRDVLKTWEAVHLKDLCSFCYDPLWFHSDMMMMSQCQYDDVTMSVWWCHNVSMMMSQCQYDDVTVSVWWCHNHITCSCNVCTQKDCCVGFYICQCSSDWHAYDLKKNFFKTNISFSNHIILYWKWLVFLYFAGIIQKK